MMMQFPARRRRRDGTIGPSGFTLLGELARGRKMFDVLAQSLLAAGRFAEFVCESQ